MNLFTIITTIISIILSGISVYAAFKGSSPQTIRLTETIEVKPYDDFEIKNRITKIKWLTDFILILIVIIILLTGFSIYKEIPSTGSASFPIFNYLSNLICYTIGKSSTYICITLPILLIGSIFKNIKANYLPYRIFNIIFYFLSTVLSLIFIFAIYKVNYLAFIPQYNTVITYSSFTDYAISFLLLLTPLYIMFQLFLITETIIYLVKNLFFDEQKSRLINVTAKLFFYKFIVFISFILLILFWQYAS